MFLLKGNCDFFDFNHFCDIRFNGNNCLLKGNCDYFDFNHFYDICFNGNNC